MKVRVLVTCVGGRLVYDFVRGLRAAEDFDAHIIGVDADPNAAGRLLCDEFHVAPMAEDSSEAYMGFMTSLLDGPGFDVLIPLSEGETRVVARHRQALRENGVAVSVSDSAVVEKMTDKLLMLEAVKGAGLEAGDFRAIDSSDDLRSACEALGYRGSRVVIKPRRGRGSRGVLIADVTKTDFERLLPERFCGTGSVDAIIEAATGEGEDFKEHIAVPYYAGPVFDVDCIARNGVAIDVVARLRQLKNPLWPTSTGHRVDQHPEVIGLARKLCSALQVDGAADFDIIVTDDGARLIDAGARFSGSVGGSVTAGANFPAQLVRVLSNLPFDPLSVRDKTVIRPFITMAEIPRANENDFL